MDCVFNIFLSTLFNSIAIIGIISKSISKSITRSCILLTPFSALLFCNIYSILLHYLHYISFIWFHCCIPILILLFLLSLFFTRWHRPVIKKRVKGTNKEDVEREMTGCVVATQHLPFLIWVVKEGKSKQGLCWTARTQCRHSERSEES